VDQSLAMLRQARLRCGPATRLLQVGMCRLGLRGDFALVSLPYSLVTHFLDQAASEALRKP